MTKLKVRVRKEGERWLVHQSDAVLVSRLLNRTLDANSYDLAANTIPVFRDFLASRGILLEQRIGSLKLDLTYERINPGDLA